MQLQSCYHFTAEPQGSLGATLTPSLLVIPSTDSGFKALAAADKTLISLQKFNFTLGKRRESTLYVCSAKHNAWWQRWESEPSRGLL